MIIATFGAGGFCRRLAAIYLILFRNSRGKVVWLYIGRTRTSNKKGQRSPYERLAKHLCKVGNTSSCIWNQSRCLKKPNMGDLRIEFYSVFVKGNQVEMSEQWMLWKARNNKKILLNASIPENEPDFANQRPKELNALAKKLPNSDC